MSALLTLLGLLFAGITLASEPLSMSSVSKLYPVPTRNTLNIVTRGDVHGYRLVVARIDGRLMWHANFPPSDGQYHTVTLDTSRFRTGMYTLTYRSDFPGGAYAVRRFMVLR